MCVFQKYDNYYSLADNIKLNKAAGATVSYYLC